MNHLLQDLRFAVRQLRRSPGFALTAILTLALGIAANVIVFGVLQGLILRSLDVPLDLVASSTRWGVEKPAPEFFARISAELAVPPDQVAYVGDRLDNDILPAAEAGMVTVLIRRGPWGRLHARRPDAAVADALIDGLEELPAVLRRMSP